MPRVPSGPRAPHPSRPAWCARPTSWRRPLPRPPAEAAFPTEAVRAILDEVRTGGDEAVRDAHRAVSTASTSTTLRVPPTEIDAALGGTRPRRCAAALELAYDRILAYHRHEPDARRRTSSTTGWPSATSCGPSTGPGCTPPGAGPAIPPPCSCARPRPGWPAWTSSSCACRPAPTAPSPPRPWRRRPSPASTRSTGSAAPRPSRPWPTAPSPSGPSTSSSGPGNRYVAEAKRQVAGIVGRPVGLRRAVRGGGRRRRRHPGGVGRHRPRRPGRARPRRPGLAGHLVGRRWPTPSTAEVDRLVAALAAAGRPRGHPGLGRLRRARRRPGRGAGGGQRGGARAPRAPGRRGRGAAPAGAPRRRGLPRARTRRPAWATTWPGPTTCCPRPARPASPRRLRVDDFRTHIHAVSLDADGPGAAGAPRGRHRRGRGAPRPRRVGRVVRRGDAVMAPARVPLRARPGRRCRATTRPRSTWRCG